jgi:thiol:disulfide interchange protein
MVKSSKVFLSLLLVLAIVACGTKKGVVKNQDPNDVQIVDGKAPDKDTEKLEGTENSEEKPEYTFEFVSSNSLSDVLDLASSLNKPVYLSVGAKWCVPCKLMQRDVYTHKPTADFFNMNLVNYEVEIDKKEGPDLKLIYNIQTVPTLIWLDSKGRVLHRKEGAAYHAELIKNAEIALANRK